MSEEKLKNELQELSLPELVTPDNIKTFVLTETERGFNCQLGGEEDSLEDGVNAIIIDGGGDYAGFWACAQFVNYSDGIKFKIDEYVVFKSIVSAYLSHNQVKFIIKWMNG